MQCPIVWFVTILVLCLVFLLAGGFTARADESSDFKPAIRVRNVPLVNWYEAKPAAVVLLEVPAANGR